MTRVALIPARASSKRLPGKNTKLLGGIPLIRWTIQAAKDSGIFDDIFVCTDDPKAQDIAFHSGVHVFHRHPVPDDQKDIDWLTDFFPLSEATEAFLLRPTSPFRSAATLRRALDHWEATKDRLDSLRAMRRATETGWKQWVVEDCTCSRAPMPYGPCGGDPCQSVPCQGHKTMRPLTTAAAKKHLHSFPTQSLEDCYIQTAGLEIFHSKTILEKGTLAGDHVGMFLMEGVEALDINSPEDWKAAERHLRNEKSPQTVA